MRQNYPSFLTDLETKLSIGLLVDTAGIKTFQLLLLHYHSKSEERRGLLPTLISVEGTDQTKLSVSVNPSSQESGLESAQENTNPGTTKLFH